MDTYGKWDNCSFKVNEEDLEDRVCYGGLDLSSDPAGNIKADKEKSTEKIDGAVAMIMPLDRAIRCGNDTGASVYGERGILFI